MLSLALVHLAQATLPPGVTSYNVVSTAIHDGLGIKCEARGREYDSWGREWFIGVSPTSYAGSDIGKKGVPVVMRSDLHVLHQIQRYVHTKTMRFIINGEYALFFDAYDGPCIGWAAGYAVLNGGCNEYYQPSGEFKTTYPVPSCMPPRPWVGTEAGKPGSESWLHYRQR